MCKKFLKNRKKVNYQAERKNPSGFWSRRTGIIALMLLVAFMGVYYLGLINDKATVGYKISKLQTEASDLAETNRNLELQIIDLQQTARIEERAKGMAMVQADNVEYLAVQQEKVAVR